MIMTRECIRLPMRFLFFTTSQLSSVFKIESRLNATSFATNLMVNSRLDTQNKPDKTLNFKLIPFKSTIILFLRYPFIFTKDSNNTDHTPRQNPIIFQMYCKNYTITPISSRCYHSSTLACTRSTLVCHNWKRTLFKGDYTSLRHLMKSHGWNFIVTYLTVYIITLSSFFVSIDSGLINSDILSNTHFAFWSLPPAETDSVVDSLLHDGIPNSEVITNKSPDNTFVNTSIEVITSFLERFECTLFSIKVIKENPHISNLALAWVITKITEPIRVIFVLAITSRVNILGKR